MPPIHDDIVLHKEDDFSRTYVWQDDAGNPIDLTDWAGTSQIRSQAGSDLLASFTVDFPDRVAGEFRISMPAADVDQLDFSKAHFDIVLTNATTAEQRKKVKGAVTVEGTITELP